MMPDAAAQGMVIIDAGHYGLEPISLSRLWRSMCHEFRGAIEVIQAEPGFSGPGALSETGGRRNRRKGERVWFMYVYCGKTDSTVRIHC